MSLVLRSDPEARVTFFSSRQTHCKQIFVRYPSNVAGTPALCCGKPCCGKDFQLSPCFYDAGLVLIREGCDDRHRGSCVGEKGSFLAALRGGHGPPCTHRGVPG